LVESDAQPDTPRADPIGRDTTRVSFNECL
jgi:hypothetical protein